MSQKVNRLFFPNGLDQADDINNSERVRVGASDGDQFMITVVGTDLVTAFQSFSLAVTGCFEEVLETLTPEVFPVKETVEKELPVDGRIEGSLMTTFNGGVRQAGNMFDVIAKQDIVVTGMDINTRVTDSTKVMVYSKFGSHTGFESDPSFWTLIGETEVIGKGKNTPTSLPEDSIYPVYIQAGDTQSFYVTTEDFDIVYTHGAPTDILASNDDLEILEGVGNAYQFGEIFPGRNWNGVLRYYMA